MNTNLTKEFFDFYALNLLNYFAGSNSLNHNSRAERISAAYEERTNSLYEKIHRALTYSVLREMRHFVDRVDFCVCTSNVKNLIDLSVECMRNYKTGALDRFVESKRKSCPIKCDLSLLLDAYYSYEWERDYGGRRWGEGVKFLMNLPKSSTDKQLWVDRVLDLYHNNGHILNKTEFHNLGYRGYHRKNQTPRHNRNALNYRRYAATISDLTKYSSAKTRRLVTANLNYIPQQIR